ncbi:MAG: hypothetical protein AVDCRST_MAG95-126 [uncultured Adhaeribacter sp.]|uniref:Uncharacterized protein n=1 Tax=uncultured Adhaeribacter sp. TaxID=448109 RepID=A0A6J4H4K9_9BACT|nr:MAG: hypothetical protein AVDCRST_MAG95-126 [uncultured Adhaeribacter sp.]
MQTTLRKNLCIKDYNKPHHTLKTKKPGLLNRAFLFNEI